MRPRRKETEMERKRERKTQGWKGNVVRKRKSGRHQMRQKKKREREEMKVKKKKKKIEVEKNQRQREGCSWGREGHVLLNEDFHQVDVAAGGRGMQGRPQLVVLGVHIGTVGKEQLDNFLKVVNAALQGGHRQGQLPAGPWVVTRAHQVPPPPRGHKKDSRAKLPEFESSSITYMLCDLGQVT